MQPPGPLQSLVMVEDLDTRSFHFSLSPSLSPFLSFFSPFYLNDLLRSCWVQNSFFPYFLLFPTQGTRALVAAHDMRKVGGTHHAW